MASDATFSRTATGSGSGPYVETLTFSDASVLSPTSGYTGPTFYGGYQFSSSTVDSYLSRQQIRNGTTVDRVTLQAYHPSGFTGSELSLQSAFIFQQADFASGHTAGSNTITSLSVKSNSFGAAFVGRFIVEVGGAYYVSNSTASFSSSATTTLDGAPLTAETWATYNPITDLNFDQDTATFAALALNDVTAVGVYIEADSYTGTGNSPFAVGFDNFTVQGTTTVPEPETFALIIGLGALGGAIIRRRHR